MPYLVLLSHKCKTDQQLSLQQLQVELYNTKVMIDTVTITTYAYDNCDHIEHNTALRQPV